MTEKLLAVIVGATGNQGGSVARRFIQDPRFRVRGLTRNPQSATAHALTELGVEMVRADIDDVDSLKAAFRGANLIFSVTDYMQPFFRVEARERAAELGVEMSQYAGDLERQQGINIALAAASTVDTLQRNGFIASTLSHATKSSHGRFNKIHHFDAKADVFPYYVDAHLPALAAKMSCVQTGYFAISYRIGPAMFLRHIDPTTETSDGHEFESAFPTDPTARVPIVDIVSDMGPFVYAVANHLPAGKAYMCAGSHITWPEYMRIWSEGTGKKGRYRQVTMQQAMELLPQDPDLAREMGDMFDYSSAPGYDGGDDTLLWPDDVRKLLPQGVTLKMTTWEEYVGKEDWTEVFRKKTVE